MNNTPRTENIISEISSCPRIDGDRKIIHFARQLEGELNDAQTRRKQYAESLQQIAEIMGAPFESGAKIVERVKDMKAQLEEARKALCALCNAEESDFINGGRDNFMKALGDFSYAITEAQKDVEAEAKKEVKS